MRTGVAIQTSNYDRGNVVILIEKENDIFHRIPPSHMLHQEL